MTSSSALLLLFQIILAGAVDLIRFEAEDAHNIGCIKKRHEGYSGSHYVNFIKKEDYSIFTLNIPTDGEYLVSMSYNSENGARVQVRPNGYDGFITHLSALNKIHKMDVGLRQGVNTIIVKSLDESSFNLDYIEVFGAIPLATRGATLPYTEFEAEDATHNGVVIGPDRTYLNLPSEASGRKAVNLTLNQYVEFTLTSSANGIVVRLSIPDSTDGNGLTGILGVSVDGTPTLNLSVTSQFSWTYGSYPFVNDPGAGDGHHFFDETRGLFKSTIGAGSKVRLIPLVGNFIFTIDLVDFYTVPGPYSPPSGFLDVTSYGADPSGKIDSTEAFQKAINDAQSQGKGLWLPQGTFLVTQYFQINNLTIRGAGPWYTAVQATVPHGVGFFGNWAPNASQNVQLFDFAMFGDTVYRDDNVADSGTGGALSNTLIQNLWIEHTKCGMWLDGPFTALHVTGVTIRNTWADGINFHMGITNSVVEQSILRNLGDDGLAMWSQTDADVSNIFKFNTIQVPVLANGIAIYGGTDNQATDNYAADTVCEGGGLQADNRFTSVPLNGTTILARNTVVRCGAPNRYNTAHNGALWFWANDADMTTPINITDLEIIDSSYAGLTFWGSQITNITFTNVNITGGPYVAEVQGPNGQADFYYTVATGLTKGGIYSCNPGFIFNQVIGCSGWSDVHCGNEKH